MKKTRRILLQVMFALFSGFMITSGIAYNLELIKLFLITLAGGIASAEIFLRLYKHRDQQHDTGQKRQQNYSKR